MATAALVINASVPPTHIGTGAWVRAVSAAAASWPVSHHSVKKIEAKETRVARSQPSVSDRRKDAPCSSLRQMRSTQLKKPAALRMLVQWLGTPKRILPTNTAANI